MEEPVAFAPCKEPECHELASTIGFPYVLGHDDKREPVWFIKWSCLAGHFYQGEVIPDD